ncbi:MinD/ParA family protein [Actinomadura sp. DC4]|uniref:MinD/ParA family ATP-binding protein n=1 Tax=Actinomadura sp. DC4 TaxID=3055069 RepID=UPI0025B24C33|nr:MinD/ParA family protein [Actinomadura sp. DC4]MDN3358850.1 MinD/ParA family protein [Actinomadura sp. DC4]
MPGPSDRLGQQAEGLPGPWNRLERQAEARPGPPDHRERQGDVPFPAGAVPTMPDRPPEAGAVEPDGTFPPPPQPQSQPQPPTPPTAEDLPLDPAAWPSADETQDPAEETRRDSQGPPPYRDVQWAGPSFPGQALDPLHGRPAPPPEPGHRSVHGDPLLRRVGRGVRRAVGASAAQDVHDWAAVAAGLRQPITTIRRIVVSSVRGGAGKTTVAALMASALARHRPDRVLLIDADPGLGSLPMRFGMTGAPSLRDLAGRRPNSFEEVAPHLARTDGGLWVLPGVRGEMAEQPLDLATYASATSALTRFFTVVVVDCGVGMVGELPEAILASAHACVHVAPATSDGAVGVGRALDWMRKKGFGELLPRTVTVFATHAPHARPDLSQAAGLLHHNGVGVAYLPYDRHLASGGVLVPSLLAESTRTAALTLAADALTRANR